MFAPNAGDEELSASMIMKMLRADIELLKLHEYRGATAEFETTNCNIAEYPKRDFLPREN